MENKSIFVYLFCLDLFLCVVRHVVSDPSIYLCIRFVMQTFTVFTDFDGDKQRVQIRELHWTSHRFDGNRREQRNVIVVVEK